MMVGGFNFCTSAVGPAFVLFAVGPPSPMGLPEEAFGLLLTTTAAGAVTGSVLSEMLIPRLGRTSSLVASILGGALFVGVPLATTSPYLIGATWFVGGLTIGLWNVVTVSLRQTIVPEAMLGRLNAAYRLVAWGTMPLAPGLAV